MKHFKYLMLIQFLITGVAALMAYFLWPTEAQFVMISVFVLLAGILLYLAGNYFWVALLSELYMLTMFTSLLSFKFPELTIATNISGAAMSTLLIYGRRYLDMKEISYQDAKKIKKNRTIVFWCIMIFLTIAIISACILTVNFIPQFWFVYIVAIEVFGEMIRLIRKTNQS